jgi:hypothetical protein
LLSANVDVLAVERFARLADERQRVEAELDRGVLLAEPLISPRGDVVGHRLVENPSYGLLRAIDKELDALSDRLGLTPAARARLGLTVTSAEKQRLEVEAVLAGKFGRPS